MLKDINFVRKIAILGALLALSAPAMAQQTPSQGQFMMSLVSNLAAALGQIDSQKTEIDKLKDENKAIKDHLDKLVAENGNPKPPPMNHHPTPPAGPQSTPAQGGAE